MNCRVLLGLALSFLPASIISAAEVEPPEGFVALFNGKDLAGWKGVIENGKPQVGLTDAELAAKQEAADIAMRAHWSVVDGELVFDGEGQSLSTIKDYGDFELMLDWKIPPAGDSGIYLRGCPQVQIWDTTHEPYFRLGANTGSGCLWNNKIHANRAIKNADRPIGEWNTFRIRMVGSHVTVALNGQVVVDDTVLENYWDRSRPIDPVGPIFLQDHGNILWFRNIFLREIGADEANKRLTDHSKEFQTIIRGNELKRWAGATQNYDIADGVLTCREGKGGTLYTKKQYTDFVAQLQFKLPPGGNNGLVIRYPGEGQPHIDGFCELQVLDSEHPKFAGIHPTQFHGSVYGLVPAARGFLRPTGEWNYQRVTVEGPNVIVELNGFEILNADVSTVTETKSGDPPPPGVAVRTGHFGFAGHNDPVSFRNVQIRELP